MKLDLLYEINGTRSKMLINEQASIVSKLRRFIPKGVDSELDDIIKRIDNPRQGVNSLSPAQMTKVIQAIPPKKVADVILTQVLDQTTLKGISDNFVSQLIGGTKTWEEVTTQLQGGRGTMFNMFPNGVPSDLLNVSDEVIKGIEKNIKDNLEQTSPDVYKKIFGNVVSDTYKKIVDLFKNSKAINGYGNKKAFWSGMKDGWKTGSEVYKLLAKALLRQLGLGKTSGWKKFSQLSREDWKKIVSYTLTPTSRIDEIWKILRNDGVFKAAVNLSGDAAGRGLRLWAVFSVWSIATQKAKEYLGWTPDDLYQNLDDYAGQAWLARIYDGIIEGFPSIGVVIPATVFWEHIGDPALKAFFITGQGGDVEREAILSLTQGLSVPDSLPSTMKNQLDSSQQRSVRIDSKTGQYFLGTRDNLMRYKGNEWQVEYQGNWYKVSDMKRQ